MKHVDNTPRILEILAIMSAMNRRYFWSCHGKRAPTKYDLYDRCDWKFKVLTGAVGHGWSPSIDHVHDTLYGYFCELPNKPSFERCLARLASWVLESTLF